MNQGRLFHMDFPDDVAGRIRPSKRFWSTVGDRPFEHGDASENAASNARRDDLSEPASASVNQNDDETEVGWLPGQLILDFLFLMGRIIVGDAVVLSFGATLSMARRNFGNSRYRRCGMNWPITSPFTWPPRLGTDQRLHLRLLIPRTGRRIVHAEHQGVFGGASSSSSMK